MSDYKVYTDTERAAYLSPACERCGQRRHIVWEDRGEDTAHWLPRDAGCTNEACTA